MPAPHAKSQREAEQTAAHAMGVDGGHDNKSDGIKIEDASDSSATTSQSLERPSLSLESANVNPDAAAAVGKGEISSVGTVSGEDGDNEEIDI